MLDKDGNIMLIDFGFAGKIGTRIPAYFPPWKFKQPLFSIETDVNGLEK